MDLNRVIEGDARLELAKFPDGCVDLIIADPPYNLGKNYGNNRDLRSRDEYLTFTREWIGEAVRVLKPTGSIYIFMGFKFIGRLSVMLEDDFKLNFNSWITWYYTQGMGRKKGFSPRHEDILLFTKSNVFTFNLDEVRVPQKYYRQGNNMSGANPGDVWQFSHVHYCSAARFDHPTQKPEGLMERMIKASSNEGDLVVDPFVGSGTTVRVANVLNRNWIGIELNPEYVSMTRDRLKLPFSSFDSVDPRASRTPMNLP